MRPLPLSSREADLVARIRAGDECAFETLFREHYHGLCVFASKLVGSEAEAEELVQDVLFRIWRLREQWQVNEMVRPYLYAAVRNQALGAIRHEQVVRRWRTECVQEETAHRAGFVGRSPLADERVREAELAVAIDNAVERLAPRCRQAYLLRRRHHLSYDEIARVMQIAPKTVEIQIGAALRALRKALAEYL